MSGWVIGLTLTLAWPVSNFIICRLIAKMSKSLDQSDVELPQRLPPQ